MKRVYAALLLLAVILGTAFAERYVMKKASGETVAAIERAETALSERQNAEQACREVHECWHRNKPALELFLPHDELDAADLTAHKLVLYCEQGDEANTSVYISEMRDRMNALGDSEMINIYNLL